MLSYIIACSWVTADRPPGLSSCYIYTFDSLEGSHNRVVNRLKTYLDEEAIDKKRHDNPAGCDAVGVEVFVPLQEGYSNCGLYILHYVERFLRDDGAIRNFIHVSRATSACSDVNRLTRVEGLFVADGGRTCQA